MLRLTKVDELILVDHSFLNSSDDCHFLREYIPHVGFIGSETNSLISNFKKSPEKKGRYEWRYKTEAIRQIAADLAKALNPAWLKTSNACSHTAIKEKGQSALR